MASTAITSSIFQEIQNFSHARRTDLQQLASALQSGNLDAAQQVFSDLAAIGKNGPFKNGEPLGNSERAQAFEAIGQALQSGDLAGAQAAFSHLQATFANRGGDATTQGSPAVILNIGGGQNSTTGAESIFQQLQAFRHAGESDLKQLGAALQSGNTSSAQQAFNALVALGQTGLFSNGTAFQRGDQAQAFNAIGTALQNGDLAGAQQAFASLVNSLSKDRQPAPVATAAPASTSPEIVINLGGSGGQSGTNPEVVIKIASEGASGSSATPEQIQINLAGGSGSGGQLTISQSLNSSGGEHVAIDFLQQNNDCRIALDLLNPKANTAAQSNALNLRA